ncbi:MAG: hypothetical protein EXR77_06355 [Myxococcales bacterium]|nr:hypothetical protein [Myxococcales bacterium]
MKVLRIFGRAVVTCVCLTALFAGCSETPTTPAAVDTGEDPVDATDGGAIEGGPTADSTATPDGDSGPAVGDSTNDGTVAPDGDTSPDAVTEEIDAVSSETVVDGDVAVMEVTGDVLGDSGPPKPKLPLPDCAVDIAANCLSKCDEAKICVDGTTYFNDCDAIAKLKAFDWPGAYEPKIKKGACPECKDCTNIDIKCNTQNGANVCTQCEAGKCTDSAKACTKNTDCVNAFEVCATLKSGAKITVDMACKTKCMDLTTEGTAVANGKCKSSCSQPEPAGGGCPINIYQPICAKEDGKTYNNPCAMKNCEKQGCYGVGLTAKSDLCQNSTLTKECEGECFAEASKVSETAKNCPKDCNAVCAILPTGKGQSFRNACLATNAGAKVGSCVGVSSTPKDKCAAAELYEGKGCCPSVNYINVNPVCASKQAAKVGDPDTWYTFRNQDEFTCLTAGDKLWVKQYDNACVCQCPNTGPAVCGDDGLTYVNKCQAECYNGPTFNVNKGPC